VQGDGDAPDAGRDNDAQRSETSEGHDGRSAFPEQIQAENDSVNL
jgi:hypothetical protein